MRGGEGKSWTGCKIRIARESEVRYKMTLSDPHSGATSPIGEAMGACGAKLNAITL